MSMLHCFVPPALVSDVENKLTQHHHISVHSKDSVQREATSDSNFNVSAFLEHTKNCSSPFGASLFYMETVTSTQDMMAEPPLSTLAQNGTILTCDEQTKGKGRGQNQWNSPRGCLMFSFKTLLPPMDPLRLVFFQYLVSLVMVETVREVAGRQEIPLKIKWPNDFYANSLKVGGLICRSEAVAGGKGFSVLTGLGLNVTNSEPTTCLRDLLPDSKEISRDKILATFCRRFDSAIHEFIATGFDTFERDYVKNWMHSDQTVRLADQNDVMVRIVGLSKEGSLLALDDQGQQYFLSPDGNSFDFFKGLISKKVY